MKRLSTALLTGLLAALFIAGCDRPEPKSAANEVPALKDVFDGAFLIGAAINPNHYFERDEQGAALVKRHFNTVTAENSMKWERIHPEPGRYDFENADQFVQFAEENGMFIVGHTLVWHSQIPSWVFEDAEGNPVSRDTLLARMRDHIQTVVGRYKGRVHGWDVVNEALNEDGTLRRTPFLEIIGEDYIRLAFQWAHEVDPDAELYYNDYSLENEQKRDGAVRLVKSLLDQGIPVTAIGTQGHFNLEWPSVELQEAAIEAFAEIGVKVHVTELDIDVLPRATPEQTADIARTAEMAEGLNPYAEALPDSVQELLARRYAELFDVYLRHQDAVDRVTFWGVTDGDSWKNNWPVPGRTNYPLLFDRAYQPKPAFHAIVDLVRDGPVASTER